METESITTGDGQREGEFTKQVEEYAAGLPSHSFGIAVGAMAASERSEELSPPTTDLK